MKKKCDIVNSATHLLDRSKEFNKQMYIANNEMDNLISELTLLMNKYHAEIVPDEDKILIRLLERDNVVMEQMFEIICEG